MTPEEFDNLCKAMREFPQLFYDVYLDPSFIRRPVAAGGVANPEALAKADPTPVDEFIDQQLDDEEFLIWSELQDLRNSDMSRLIAQNQELKAFYELREIFRDLIKLKHNGKGFVAIWSPKVEPAGVLSILRGSLGFPASQAAITQDGTLQRLRQIAVENSQHLDYLRPFITEAMKENFGAIAKYSTYIQEKIEEKFTRQQQLRTTPKHSALALEHELALYNYVLDRSKGKHVYMSTELFENIKEYETKISDRQIASLIIRMLESIYDVPAMEQEFHARNEYAFDSVENIKYFIYKNIICQIGVLSAAKMSLPFDTVEDVINCFTMIYNELQAQLPSISNKVVDDMIKRRSEKEQISPQYIHDIQPELARGISTLLIDIINAIIQKYQQVFNAVMDINRNWSLLRIIINNMQLKIGPTNITLLEAAKSLNGYIDYVRSPASDTEQGANIAHIYMQQQLSKEAQHALAYKFARYCIPVESGKHVTISLVNKFKGDSPQAQQNRMNCMVLEMLERNVVPTSTEEKFAPVIDLYRNLKSAADATPPAKRARSSASTTTKDELLHQIETGNITTELLTKVLALTVEERMDIFRARYVKHEATPRASFRP